MDGREQHQAVLAWLVEGACQWVSGGLVLPFDSQAIREATRSGASPARLNDPVAPCAGRWSG